MPNPIFHRLPQTKSIDSLRFLSPISPFTRLIAAAVSSPSNSLEILTLSSNPSPNLALQSSLPSPSRITSLKSTRIASSSCISVAFSTCAGSVHFAFLDPADGLIESQVTVDGPVHRGPVSGLDIAEGEGGECVSVGMDGRVCVVGMGHGERVESRRVGDSKGLVGYSTVRWGSEVEFATGSLGFGVQWWDTRRPEGLVLQFKGNWDRGNVSGMVHSIDIHPSRKHTCIVGGSSGTIFAWDLRWQKQPIMLSRPGLGEIDQSPSESEVWKIQYDSHTLSSSTISAPSTKILPIMMCSEDGILAVLNQGEEPAVLLEEPCAINAFDIDPQNPSDVICALEWESIGFLSRQKMATY